MDFQEKFETTEVATVETNVSSEKQRMLEYFKKHNTQATKQVMTARPDKEQQEESQDVKSR